MYKIFDVHTHTYPEAIAEKAVTALGKFYDFVPEGKGIYRELEQIGTEAKVSGFLLFIFVITYTNFRYKLIAISFFSYRYQYLSHLTFLFFNRLSCILTFFIRRNIGIRHRC